MNARCDVCGAELSIQEERYYSECPFRFVMEFRRDRQVLWVCGNCEQYIRQADTDRAPLTEIVRRLAAAGLMGLRPGAVEKLAKEHAKETVGDDDK